MRSATTALAARFGALGLTVALILVAQAAAAAAEADSTPLAPKPPGVFKSLPTLIDWSTYKRLFNKEYSSLTQQLVRQKIFIAHTMRVMMTAVKFKMNKLAYYTSINQFSDLTPEEETRLLSGDRSIRYGDPDDEHGFTDDEEVERLLREDDNEDEDDERVNQSKSRQKRDLSDTFRFLRQSLKEAAQRPEAGENNHPNEPKQKVRSIIPSNNPDYEPIKQPVVQQAPTNDEIPEDRLAEIEQETKKLWSKVGFMRDAVQGAYNWFSSDQTEEPFAGQATAATTVAPVESKPTALPKLENRVIKDWRESGCIGPVMNQGKCNSCYAVTSMAFVEWALCMSQDKVLTPISVQYMVSCGPQLTMERNHKVELFGCSEGVSRHTMKFVEEYGIELEAHMPYVSADTECPIKQNSARKQKGYIRPNVKGLIRLSPKTQQLDLALKKGPLMGKFKKITDILGYSGGILEQCEGSGGHAMLIVGHGIENSIDYLLIKNSFGTNWGIEGYMKLRRSSLPDCAKELILPRLGFPSKKALARRVKAYLAKQQSSSSSESISFYADESFDNNDGLFQ